MVEHKVLITTSGLGSRLGNITQFTNKSLVRIGDKPVISHIIESYNSKTEFIITLGHYGDQVKQFLKLAYPKLKIKFVKVDKYSGPGSSLLYSISKAKKCLQSNFIFHACDTVVNKDLIKKINPNINWIAGYKNKSSQVYRTFNTAGDKIVKLNEKGEENFDYIYIGLAGIKNYKLFWRYLFQILKTNKSTELSDYHVIKKLLNEINFNYIETNNWLDTGNVDSLKKSRKKHKSINNLLSKDDENIYFINNQIIKFFYNKKICENRVLRSKYLKEMTPKILSFSNNFYSYKYVEGKVMSDCLDNINFNRLLNWAKLNLWKRKKVEKKIFIKNAIQFYKFKTINRVNNFLKVNNHKDTSNNINNIKIPTLTSLLESIQYDELIGENATGFHGDFILENIILNKNQKFILIDWRQDFNGLLDYGDCHYDIAKLNHNLIFNHEQINNGNFVLKLDKKIKIDLLVKKINIDCIEILKKFCKKNNIDYKKIQILTALIWINMAPLHEYPLNFFLYYFGKYNLFVNLKK
mgnify:CR=1 FL=1